MSRLAERLRRLRQMGWPELRFRAAQQWRIRRERLTPTPAGPRPWTSFWNAAAVSQPRLREALEAGCADEAAALLPGYFAQRQAPHFFWDPGQREALQAAHRDAFPSRLAARITQAEAICAHRFRIFGFPEVAAGAEIRWRRDLVHGQETGLGHWSRIPYLDFAVAGDSKVVWEPNRHQHLVTLAQTWFLTGDECFAEECLVQFEHWDAANPRGRGINWSSSLELSFRLWSWLWVLHLLQGSAALRGARLVSLTRAIAEHAEFIEQNLSTYFSPNTHLLGEGFALFVTGLLLPELRGAAAWQAAGRAILDQQMTRQVRLDGWHAEQSSYYHRYALDFFQCASILADRNRAPFSSAWRAQLGRMCDVILHTQSPAGTQPMLGDADGGRLLPLGPPTTPEQSHDQRGALSTAAVYFGRGDFRRAAATLHEETLWLLGADAAVRFAAIAPMPPSESSVVFGNAGCAVQRSGWEPEAPMLLFDAGPQGMPGSAHGHADALSVFCAAGGVDWLVDPGTFAYTSSRAWRDAFRGTWAHNTALVDGQDQAVAVDFFKWRSVPTVTLERWRSTAALDIAVASHNGYGRLPQPVTHRRSVMFVKPDYWLIRDELAGDGTHDVEFFFHFAPACELHETPAGWRAWQGRRSFLLAPVATGLEMRVVRGDESTRCGWYSDEYGLREPAPALVARARVQAPACFDWLLYPAAGEGVRLQTVSADLLRVADGATGDLAYLRPHGAGLESGQGDWLATDAEAFVRRGGPTGDVRVALVNGCCVDWQGAPLLRAEAMLDSFFARQSGNELHLQAGPQRRLRYFCPDAERVFCAGRAVRFAKDDGWVVVSNWPAES